MCTSYSISPRTTFACSPPLSRLISVCLTCWLLLRGRPGRPAVLEAKRPFPGYRNRTGYAPRRSWSRVGELGDDASSPSFACIAFRDWRASAKLVLLLSEGISSSFVPRDYAILYLISRSGSKPQSPPHRVECVIWKKVTMREMERDIERLAKREKEE